jgi:tRNA (guanosine-2'-O-)-methyltransferase
MNEVLIEFLKKFITERRWELLNTVVKERTRYITVVLEDIYQPQNASAVLRTSECFGIQNVYIIENTNEFKINPDVELGSAQWLNLNLFNTFENNTISAIEKLRKDGYRIVATTPDTNDTELENFDLNKGKIALFFGSEQPGLSQVMLDNADEYLKIPMYGFTKSFNISVSASIILHNLYSRLKTSDINWRLSSEECSEIILNWLKISIKDSDLIIKEYLRRDNL